MESTMKRFDIYKLDHYYRTSVSFKCSDILDWCTRNMDNEVFDIAYAAEEIYNHYFASGRTPNPRSYYYIKYNCNSRYLYYLERDLVLSPTNINKYISGDSIKYLLRRINEIEMSIRSHRRYDENEDGNFIKQISSIRSRRERLILKRRFKFDKFYRLSKKDKIIVKNILEDYKQDLSLRLSILKSLR